MTVQGRSVTTIKPLAAYFLGVWAIPIAIVITALVVSPDPNRPKSDFPSVTFTPTKIEIQQGRARKNADFFELWLHQPDGGSYYHRDPERDPITALDMRTPRNVPLQITFTPDSEGNVLLAIERTDTGEALLPFESVMAAYAGRRTLIFSIAGIWLLLGNLFAWGLYRAIPRPSQDEKP